MSAFLFPLDLLCATIHRRVNFGPSICSLLGPLRLVAISLKLSRMWDPLAGILDCVALMKFWLSVYIDAVFGPMCGDDCSIQTARRPATISPSSIVYFVLGPSLY